MQQNSPSVDRISSALRALRELYAQDSVDKAVLGLKCLQAVMAELASEGVPAADLKPLVDLEEVVGARAAASGGAQVPKTEAANAPPAAANDAVSPSRRAAQQRDRRRKAPPSMILLARAAVILDLLVKDGQGEERAAQSVMRHLLVAGVPAPTQGGDSRGWRRILEFRNQLLYGGGPEDARVEYEAFGREIEAIPAADRVKTVLSERLWDRRQNVRRQPV